MKTEFMTIAGLALRTARRGPMREIEHAEAEIDGGLVGDVPRKSVERGVTLLSRAQWDAVNRELNADLPWHTRRANVLLDGCESLAPLIGRRIRLGDSVEIEILGETNPCGLMEWLHPGLYDALVPDCRGGVYGRVRAGGELRVGDAIQLLSM